MKIFLVFILSIAIKYTTGQITQLTTAPELKTMLVQPINLRFSNNAVHNIQSYIRADINQKLFENLFRIHLQHEQPFTTYGNAGLITQRLPFFDHADLNKRLQYRPGHTTLDDIAELAGSILDMMLEQQIVQDKMLIRKLD